MGMLFDMVDNDFNRSVYIYIHITTMHVITTIMTVAICNNNEHQSVEYV